MNLFIIIGFCAAVFIMMCIDSNKSCSKTKFKDRDEDRRYAKEAKKMADVTKRMEILHQEQEIARVSSRFASNNVNRSQPIRLNRNF